MAPAPCWFTGSTHRAAYKKSRTATAARGFLCVQYSMKFFSFRPRMDAAPAAQAARPYTAI